MTFSRVSANDIGARIGGITGLLECGGNSVYYEIVGEGPPIVLLHDGLLHGVAFDSQIETFKDRYTLIRYDRPSFGNSPPPTTSFSHVVTLDDLLNHMGIGAGVLLGGSAGGRIALDFALTHPAKAKALILVGAALSGYEFTDHMLYRGWRNEWGESSEDIIDFWCDDPWLIASDNIEAKEAFRKALMSYPNNLERQPVEVFDDHRALDRLSEIAIPTLVVIGESDIADNHAIAGILHNSIPTSRREIVTRSGHLAYLEQPDQLNKLVGDFLEEIEEAGSA